MAPNIPYREKESSKDECNRPVLKLTRLSPLIILLVSLSIYGNALLNGFVYDDSMQVVENPWIRDAGYLQDIFSKNAWSFKSQRVVSNYYRPFMHVIYMINYHVFGLTPWGFHLVNLLFHALNAVLVFLIASRLLGEHMTRDNPSSLLPLDKGRKGGATMGAGGLLSPPFIAALLFAAHPIHTEAVTWIAGLPDLSCSFFFLLSFYLYMRFTEDLTIGSVIPICSESLLKKDSRPGGSPEVTGQARMTNGHAGMTKKASRYLLYLFSVVSFFFAALSKEPALTLPFILAAYDHVLKKGRGRLSESFKRYLPFLVVAAGYLLLRFDALGGFAPDKRHADLSVYQYVINVFPLFIQYLEKLLFPVNLNAFYVFHPVSSLLEMKGILSLIGAAAFVIASCAAFKKSKAAFFSLLLIVVPLLPVLYIPGLSVNIFAERYLYLPSVGFVMLPALLVARAGRNHPKWAAGLAAGAVIVAGLYSMGTVNRNAVWRDDYTLWADTVRKSPDGALAQVNFGQALQMRGRRDEAIEHYQLASRLDPKDPITHFNLGLAFFLNGRMDMAIGEFQIALSQDPDYPEAVYYLQLAMSSKSQRR